MIMLLLTVNKKEVNETENKKIWKKIGAKMFSKMYLNLIHKSTQIPMLNTTECLFFFNQGNTREAVAHFKALKNLNLSLDFEWHTKSWGYKIYVNHDF